jgi:acyl-CoA reductase-like NAD-dependent aldehyde dehydrogenase
MGPLATRNQLDHIERQVGTARAQGANVLHGGGRPAEINAGWFYQPTIIESPDQKLDIVDTELFGPVLSVLRFRDEDEVVRHANDTKYGLACGIFTKDVGRAHRVARATRAGIVWINTYRVVSPIAEFGGFKDSGYGREGGFQAIYDYTRPKTVWINTSPEPISNPFVMR